jgi:hypothetical protein
MTSKHGKFSATAGAIVVLMFAAPMLTAGPARARPADNEQQVIALASPLEAAVRAAIADSTPETREAKVREALEGMISDSGAAPEVAEAACNTVQRTLSKTPLWTGPVARAFASVKRTIRAAMDTAATASTASADGAAPDSSGGGGGGGATHLTTGG